MYEKLDEGSLVFPSMLFFHFSLSILYLHCTTNCTTQFVPEEEPSWFECLATENIFDKGPGEGVGIVLTFY